jgi:hypothetical protein
MAERTVPKCETVFIVITLVEDALLISMLIDLSISSVLSVVEGRALGGRETERDTFIPIPKSFLFPKQVNSGVN